MFRFIFTGILLLGSLALPLLAQTGTDSDWHQNRVNSGYINKRIDDLAIQYKEYAPIPKMAIYDIGYPRNAQEYDQLDGHGLLLVAALSQVKEELPIKRVYVSLDGKEIDLNRLKMYLSESKDAASQSFKTLGAFRMDALFAFPVHFRTKTAEVFIQFAKDSKPMRLAAFNGTVPESLKTLPTRMPTEKTLKEKALGDFMKREYPGYFQN